MRIYHTTGNIIQHAAWLPLRAIFSIFLRMEFRGVDNVKKLKKNAVFASNHANEFDPLIIVSCLPFFSRHIPLVFVSREKSFYEKLGWRGKIYGGLFFKLMASLQTYTGLNDYRKALKHHIEALKCGRNVCIFPMGKKHLDEDIHQAKGGVSYLAATSNLPVVPVRISSIEYMKDGDFWKRKRKLQVTFGEPVYFKELSGSDSANPDKDLCERTAVSLMERIIALDSSN
ncbi:MAG: lysophospholipid acyltransferase family protein [bacterium]|nr:lysophospholipid acyltransferase family protein [bacterium]